VHDPGLDVLRALAILLVLFSHGALLIQNAVDPGGQGLGVSVGAAWWPCSILGVELFFVLSGFLIGGILLRIEAEGATARAAGIFLVRRWMRTVPLYALTLAMLSLAPMLDTAPHRLLPYLTMTQNLAAPFAGQWFAPSWSLTIEEWSYLVFPLLAYGVLRWTRHGVAWAAVALIVLGFTMRIAHAHGGADWDAVIRRLGVCRADAIAYGVLLAAWLRRGGDRARRTMRRWAPAGLVVLAAAVWGLPKPFAGTSFYEDVFALPALAVAMCLCLPGVLGWRLPGVVAAPVRFVARVSYAAYLCHWPVLTLVRHWPAQLAAPVFFGATFGLAALLSWAIERPVMRLRPRQWAGARVAPAG
jgi:peptidoglycan/LPS O-acetylase OafA/YrhL